MRPMKTRLTVATVLAVAVVVTLFSACVLAARGEEIQKAAGKSVTAELEKAKERLAATYLLAYKFASGDEFRTKVIHLATVETKIKGVGQTTKSRTVSTRQWRIKEVAASGDIVFENIVEHVEMWNSVEGRQEMKYDSAVDKSPPPQFEQVAASIGKVLAKVTIDRHGRILARENNERQFNPSIGELTIPFPNVAVKTGATWSIPEEVRIRLEDGIVKMVQTRQQYRLEKVEAGVATIALETQVLTPVNDPKVQVELVQRLQRGTIKFDVDAGRLIHKQLDMDQSVFGFNGADSHMQYLARFTEEPVQGEEKTALGGGVPEPKRK
jgi:hypothetical protein